MRCSSCGSDNRERRKFCAECGAELMLACEVCGAKNRPGERFCGNCGKPLADAAKESPRDPRGYTPKHLAEKILTTRSALEGERKQVTVLFADLKGSMYLGEKVDPEEWYRIMDRFFQILSDGVQRFEGTVDKFTGDGIMAIFGAPIAHEDHARRACYAALHLKEELRRYADELKRTRELSFAVRMGLNSGEVVVGTIGDDLKMVYTAHGNTVGLGQRMEQLATPDQVYLTENSAKLVSGFFRLLDLGPLELKGVSAPVRVYELEGVGALHTPLEVSRSRGFSRFVGRSAELASLEAALSRALDGTGQVVGIVGEPGVGKSRLCQEFVERCLGRSILVYGGHGVSHGKAIPYLPILELFRGFFRITERDDEKAAREKIAGRMLALDETLRDALPLTFEFLGVADPEHPAPRIDPDARRRQLFATVKRVAQAASLREPAVILLEDLHWFDPGSEAFLEGFVEAAAGTRSLLVVNFRPEYHAAWMQKSYYQQIPLLPLPAEAVGELLHELLGTDPSLARLGNRIRERTGGNPFFIEEIVQALAEAGSLVGSRGAYRVVQSDADLVLPATVQAVIGARIDRLAGREKDVIQTAAVIGKEFSEPIMKRVSDLSGAELAASLHHLMAAEFLYEKTVYPEAEYAFKHPLTQEVAYRSQLGEHRRRVHAAVAQAIAELRAANPDEHAALIAHHWEAAGESLRAARWHGRAAEHASKSHVVEGLRHWRKAHALLQECPPSEESTALAIAASRAMLSLGARVGLSNEEARQIFDEGVRLAERSRDLYSLGWLHVVYGAVRGFAGDEEARVTHASKALGLATQVSDSTLEVTSAIQLAWAHLFLGHLQQALSFADRAGRGTSERLGVGAADAFASAVWVHQGRGIALLHMGRLDDGRREFDRALALSTKFEGTEGVAWVHGYCSSLAWFAGDVKAALEHARVAFELAEKMGSSYLSVLAGSMLGAAYVLCGEPREGVRVLERGRAQARERGAGLRWEAHLLTHLADARLRLGETSQARALAEEAVVGTVRYHLGIFEPLAQIVLARVVLRAKGLAGKTAVEIALGRAESLVAETGAKSYEPFLHVERAELARLNGDDTTRRRELREAHRLFLEIGAPIRAELVAKELAG